MFYTCFKFNLQNFSEIKICKNISYNNLTVNVITIDSDKQ